MKELSVALDSDTFTYLVQAVDPDYNPKEDKAEVAEQRLSIIRAYLYSGQNYILLPTVQRQYENIRNTLKKKAHEVIHQIMLSDTDCNLKLNDIENKVKYYSKHHQGRKNKDDCNILAEAELNKIDVLLTNDNAFQKNLKTFITTVNILKPSEFWKTLNIPQGADLVIIPHPTNPLYLKKWWWHW